MKVDVDTTEVRDFITTMKRSKQDLGDALQKVKDCRSAQGWEDSNRQAFDVAAGTLEDEIERCIDSIDDTIHDLEKIADAADDIKY